MCLLQGWRPNWRLSQRRQHLRTWGGWRNCSSACFSSSFSSLSFSGCRFSFNHWRCCSRSAEDLCCARNLPAMSWPGESMRTQPVALLEGTGELWLSLSKARSALAPPCTHARENTARDPVHVKASSPAPRFPRAASSRQQPMGNPELSGGAEVPGRSWPTGPRGRKQACPQLCSVWQS